MHPFAWFIAFFAVVCFGLLIWMWRDMTRADKEYRDFWEEQRQIEKALGLERDDHTGKIKSLADTK